MVLRPDGGFGTEGHFHAAPLHALVVQIVGSHQGIDAELIGIFIREIERNHRTGAADPMAIVEPIQRQRFHRRQAVGLDHFWSAKGDSIARRLFPRGWQHGKNLARFLHRGTGRRIVDTRQSPKLGNWGS